MKKVLGLLSACLLMCGVSAGADLLDDFSRKPELREAKISPTGEYLAVLKDEEDKRVVAVFEYPEMKLINVVDFPGRSEVGGYWWVNDERLLFRVAVDWGNQESDVAYGELYAVNADGKKGKYLFGMRGNSGKSITRTTTVTREFTGASYTHPMWHDPKKVLITLNPFSRGFKSPTTTAVLDVYSGRVTNRLLAPNSNASIVPDPKGIPRFSYYIDDDQNTVIQERDPETKRWNIFSKAAYGETQIEPVDIHTDGRIIVLKSVDDGPEGVYFMDPQTQAMELVYQHELVDADALYQDFNAVMYAVGSRPAKREFQIVDPDHPSAQLMVGLRDAFPDGEMSIRTTTHDFRLSIVQKNQDTATPEFFIYDRESGSLSPLFDLFPWIDDSKLSPMSPIEITARDGVELQGYLTIPVGAEAKNLPLIIVPHGGPHGPRDIWGYPWFEGFVPASGYAMLQVNYRGSGGYGMKFERMGHGEWGRKMQDDLTDATHWAIEQGIADPDRICIFGWSYGGYATLMGIIREPDLYKCAVGGAGVYDQTVQYEQSDFAEGTRWGTKYMDKVIGPTKADRDAASPVTYVDKIQTPLLLVHGEDDARVPIEHAYVLQKAMKKAGKPVPELIELHNEAHTPRNEENNKRWRRATIEFFEKHIGPGVKPNEEASR